MGYRCAVIGGAGYVGYHLAVDLLLKGHEVIIYDIASPDPEWMNAAHESQEFRSVYHKLTTLQGDILSVDSLTSALRGVQLIFHCAAHGMSGRAQMISEYDTTERINIEGTKNIIQTACAVGALALVYTSTSNVIFGGREIFSGDETLPYFPLHRYVDHYSRTKSIAEQLVLISNGKKSEGGRHLATCALRISGVLGPMERLYLTRMTKLWYMFRLRFGKGQHPKVQFLGIENAVQAHVKAGIGLIEKSDLMGGEAYFISDGPGVTPFEHFGRLIESLGHNVAPRNTIPLWLIWAVAYFILIFHWLLQNIWDFQPLVTPAEIYHSAYTHCFCIEKAKKHFEFDPKRPNDLSKVIEYYQTKTGKRGG